MTYVKRITCLFASLQLCAFLAIASILVLAQPGEARAQVDFSGKRIVWIVPSKEGGGSDSTTRFLVPFFKKHLPGNPTIVVQNVPGTGTVPGINKYWHSAKDDGLMVLSMTIGGQLNATFGQDTVKYNLKEYIAIMGVPQGTYVYAQSNLGLKGPGDIETLRNSGKTYIIGGTSPTSAEIRLLMAYNMLGIKVKPVWGLSRGKSRQAFMRKELQLNYDTTSNWIKKVIPMVKKGTAVPLFTFGVENSDGSIVRDPAAKDIPTFLELYEKVHGKKLGGIEYKAWYAIFSTAIMNSKSVVLHPKSSPEVVAAYHKAVKDIVNDPEFQKEKTKRLGSYDINIGKRAQDILLAGADMDPKVCGWLANFLKSNYDADIICK